MTRQLAVDIVSARGTIDGAPTLAIEILSPSTARIDRQTKKQLVDADARAIEVFRGVSGAYGAPGRRDADALTDLPPFSG